MEIDIPCEFRHEGLKSRAALPGVERSDDAGRRRGKDP